MANTDSTTTDSLELGPYCAHKLRSAIDYHDAATSELNGAICLLDVAAWGYTKEGGEVGRAAVAIFAIIEKLEAAHRYVNASWALRACPGQDTPKPHSRP